jgi:Protein of unknown function (DUF2778)
MIQASFKLNNEDMSVFKMGASSWPAFSGFGNNRNKRSMMCSPSAGPIPIGNYYILTRQSGGTLGKFRDIWNGHSNWFALYADDGKIDDETMCDLVIRGNFRLHPARSAGGYSLGCVTIPSQSDFHVISHFLRSASPGEIPGSVLKAFGKLSVQ